MRAKPIETYYAGYRFRSRLEARWAVYLTWRYEFQWQYEPEGYILPNGEPYLPDFLVSLVFLTSGEIEDQFWLEIKPTPPTAEELETARLLAQETGLNCHLLAGIPGEGVEHIYTPAGFYAIYHVRPGWGGNGAYLIDRRRSAQRYGKKLNEIENIEIREIPYPQIVNYTSDDLNDQAAHFARAARFEHGETPPAPPWTVRGHEFEIGLVPEYSATLIDRRDHTPKICSDCGRSAPRYEFGTGSACWSCTLKKFRARLLLGSRPAD